MAALLVSTAPGAARAETAPAYADLLRQSFEKAPILLEQAANARAARQDARQARALPNPVAGVEFENIGGSSSPGSSNQPQTTFTVTQPFEVGGKRSARIAAGEAGIAAAQAREQQVRYDYAAQLAVSYATAEATERHLEGAQDDLTRAKEDLRAAEALVKAGKEAALRRAQASASLSAAKAVREGALADLTEALAELSALAGVAEPYTAVTPSLLADRQVPVAGPATGPSPSVAVAEAEQRALAAQVRIEAKKPIPDIGLMGGLRRFGGSEQTGVVLGLTASIPIFDRNAGGIAAAKEREEAAGQRLASARLEADAARRSALAHVAASQGRLDAAQEGESAAAEAYRLARIGYDAGKTSLLELLTTRRSLTEARSLTIDARLARVTALAALARIDGRYAFGEM